MLDSLFEDHAAWFGTPALTGTLLLALGIVLGRGAGRSPGGSDAASDADPNGEPSRDVESETAAGPTLRGFGAFCMGFGWAGLAAFRGANWALPAAVGVAVVAGVAVAWISGLLAKAAPAA